MNNKDIISSTIELEKIAMNWLREIWQAIDDEDQERLAWAIQSSRDDIFQFELSKSSHSV